MWPEEAKRGVAVPEGGLESDIALFLFWELKRRGEKEKGREWLGFGDRQLGSLDLRAL